MTELTISGFDIQEVEEIEAPGDGWFWVGVGVGVVVGIALC